MKRFFKIAAFVVLLLVFAAVTAYFFLVPGKGPEVLTGMSYGDIWTKRPASHRMLLKHVIIVDTRNGALTSDMDILLENGRITDIIPEDTAFDVAGSEIIDGEGRYVVPGFMNMHMHIIDQVDASPQLAMMLVNGITGFRQMSGSMELLNRRKQKGSLLLAEQPALLSMPGSVLTPVNTHNKQEAIENVEAQKAAGADFIKIGLLSRDLIVAVLAEGKRVGIPVLGHVPGDVSLSEASDSGFRSVEHLGLNYAALTASSTEELTLRNAAPKIPGLLNHLPGFTEKLFMSALETTLINPALGTSKEEYERIGRLTATFSETKARHLAALFITNHTWQCPTLSKLRSYQLAFLPEVRDSFGYMPKKLQEKYQEVTRKFEKQLTPQIEQELINAYKLELTLVRIYDSAGLKLLAGTDNAGGYSLVQEFNEFARAGLPPLHVLQTATINVAEFLNRADIGQVKPGNVADLVLLDGNPVESARNLNRVHAVIHAGYYFSESNLAAMKQKAAALMQAE